MTAYFYQQERDCMDTVRELLAACQKSGLTASQARKAVYEAMDGEDRNLTRECLARLMPVYSQKRKPANWGDWAQRHGDLIESGRW